MLLPRSKRRTMPVMISPRAIFVLVEDVLALGVAHALDDHLLGGLRGDAAEAVASLRDLQEIPELFVLLARFVGVFLEIEDLKAQLFAEVRFQAVALGVLLRDLTLRIAHVLDDRHVLEQIDLTDRLIVARLELTIRPERTLGSRQDRLLHRLDQNLRVDPFLTTHLIDDVL